ncbi:MAG: sel1 repeat family protein [Azonexus sp.]|jgi:TPR repeat protein|nr:sel1 repeat family protein [Azonexus sp.]
MKQQSLLLVSVFSLLLATGATLPAHAQDGGTVRICDDQGCSDRPKNAVTTETVDRGADREDPRIAKLKDIAEGNGKAACDLGLRYFRGDGVKQDSYQALLWMRKAGEQGDLKAQKALGGFYLFGLEEMGSDPQEAETWLSMAVAQGDKESEKLLEQARAGKKAEHENYEARKEADLNRRMMTTFARNWRSGYAYYGAWRRTYWSGY